MTQEHPMIPPRELVDRLQDLGNLDAIELAYQAGADQELEACCKAFEDIWDQEDVVTLTDVLRGIRAARRPKPPSLKEEALETLLSMQIQPCVINGINTNADLMAKYDILRRALESLPD